VTTLSQPLCRKGKRGAPCVGVIILCAPHRFAACVVLRLCVRVELLECVRDELLECVGCTRRTIRRRVLVHENFGKKSLASLLRALAPMESRLAGYDGQHECVAFTSVWQKVMSERSAIQLLPHSAPPLRLQLS
jgi:hypothetical protein